MHTSLPSKYATIKERNYRFKVFKDNLHIFDNLNGRDLGLVGINHFAATYEWEMSGGTGPRRESNHNFSSTSPSGKTVP